MRVTIKDIAERVNVSKTLVSLYLNRHPQSAKIAVKTKERIDQAVLELGYRPNFAARALAKGRTRTLGMIITGITDPFFYSMIDVVMGEVEKYDYRLTLTIPAWKRGGENACFEQLLSNQVDGLLCCTLAETVEPSTLEELKQKHFPLVFLSNTQKGFAASFADPRTALEEAVRYLQSRGQRKISAITQTSNAHRNQVFDVCRDCGVNSELFMEITPEENLEECCRRLHAERPGCLYIANCRIAKAVLAHLQKTAPDYHPEVITSYVVPIDDVSDPHIIGVIRAPFKKMITDAVACLIRQLENPVPGEPEQLRHSSEFIPRNRFSELGSLGPFDYVYKTL